MFTTITRVDDGDVAFSTADASDEDFPRRGVRDGVWRREGALDLREGGRREIAEDVHAAGGLWTPPA
jgi:hypothetical protein